MSNDDMIWTDEAKKLETALLASPERLLSHFVTTASDDQLAELMPSLSSNQRRVVVIHLKQKRWSTPRVESEASHSVSGSLTIEANRA